ncbi:MAG: hypothetical protein ACYC8T_30790 [Myxococcaceae bacterium]
MPGRRLKIAAVVTLVALLAGCAFTRLTDRAYLGVGTPGPTHPGRIYTGLFLLPIAVAADVVSAPAQLIAMAIWGDDFLVPFEKQAPHIDLSCPGGGADPFYGLTPEERKLLQGTLSRGGVLGLTADGQWIEIPATAEQRQQLIARAKGLAARPQPAPAQ